MVFTSESDCATKESFWCYINILFKIQEFKSAQLGNAHFENNNINVMEEPGVLNCFWKDFLEDFSNTTPVGFYQLGFRPEDNCEINSMTPTCRHNHPTIFCQCNRPIACSVQNANTVQFGGYTRRRRYATVHSMKNVLQNGVIGWLQCYMKHA